MRYILPLLMFVVGFQPCVGALIETTNVDQNPALFTWLNSEAGWIFTPQYPFDYFLNGIQTRFSASEFSHDWDRVVTLEVYDAPPIYGGHLLRQATFTPVPDLFVGAVFEPLLLRKGEPIFVGLRNIQDLGWNFNIGGLDRLPFFVSYQPTSQGLYEKELFPNPPVFLFFGEAIPEPASLMILGLGGLWLRRRRL